MAFGVLLTYSAFVLFFAFAAEYIKHSSAKAVERRETVADGRRRDSARGLGGLTKMQSEIQLSHPKTSKLHNAKADKNSALNL